MKIGAQLRSCRIGIGRRLSTKRAEREREREEREFSRWFQITAGAELLWVVGDEDESGEAVDQQEVGQPSHWVAPMQMPFIF